MIQIYSRLKLKDNATFEELEERLILLERLHHEGYIQGVQINVPIDINQETIEKLAVRLKESGLEILIHGGASSYFDLGHRFAEFTGNGESWINLSAFQDFEKGIYYEKDSQAISFFAEKNRKAIKSAYLVYNTLKKAGIVTQERIILHPGVGIFEFQNERILVDNLAIGQAGKIINEQPEYIKRLLCFENVVGGLNTNLEHHLMDEMLAHAKKLHFGLGATPKLFEYTRELIKDVTGVGLPYVIDVVHAQATYLQMKYRKMYFDTISNQLLKKFGIVLLTAKQRFLDDSIYGSFKEFLMAFPNPRTNIIHCCGSLVPGDNPGHVLVDAHNEFYLDSPYRKDHIEGFKGLLSQYDNSQKITVVIERDFKSYDDAIKDINVFRKDYLPKQRKRHKRN